MNIGKLFAASSIAVIMTAGAAMAQEVTLRIHQMLPAQAAIPAQAIIPWAEKVTAESDGRIQFEIYHAMQLGGTPASLYDQAQDGVVDIVWTILGYTPGRFPKSEVFELPFLMTNGVETSAALYNYAMEHAADEFIGVHVIALHAHGPGLFHTSEPVNTLEDIQGMKIRGGSRIVSDMLANLGAEPVGMPVPQTTEALSRGVIEGTTVPWEVTPSLRISELVTNHTGFSGDRGLYTQTFGVVMNRSTYESLPDDLRAVIDANSGLEVSREFGRIMDLGDEVGLQIATDAGNNIVTLDEAETARWREAAEVTIEEWFTEMEGMGHDGRALYIAAQEALDAVSE